MDSRTKKKLLSKAQLLMHLIQEHHGAIPRSADYGDVYREGLDAITALALPVVIRQQAMKQRRDAEAVRVTPDAYTGSHLEEYYGKMLAELISEDAAQEQWGIGRGLPTGDMQ